jgi:hypothetical protein
MMLEYPACVFVLGIEHTVLPLESCRSRLLEDLPLHWLLASP